VNIIALSVGTNFQKDHETALQIRCSSRLPTFLSESKSAQVINIQITTVSDHSQNRATPLPAVIGMNVLAQLVQAKALTAECVVCVPMPGDAQAGCELPCLK
jgi:hypothetical protein